MQTTFIVKNITQDCIENIAAMNAAEAYEQLIKWAFGDLKHCVSVKYGNGTFGDRVRWNGIVREHAEKIAFKIEPRKGYKLVTFSDK